MVNYKETYGVCGVLPSPDDDRDYSIEKLLVKAPKLPRSYMTDLGQPILNQGEVGACVGYSIANSRAIQEKIQHNADEWVEFAPMYIYGNRYSDRDKEGKPREPVSVGSGLYPREALKILKNYGICKKVYADYLVEYPECCNRYVANYKELDEHAYPYRISSYYRLKNKIDMMKAVYTLKATLICVPVYESLYFPDENGYVKPDCSGELYGYHCMTLIGYDVDKQVFIVQNSWDNTYGKKGIIYLDMDYPISEAWGMVDEVLEQELINEYGE